MAGTPSSRETMAAWLVMPPSSVMMPEARFIAGTMSGIVISVTMMSPSLTLSRSSSLMTIRAGPLTVPGLEPSPSTSTSPVPLESVPSVLPPSAACTLPLPSVSPFAASTLPVGSATSLPSSSIVVIGRDWSM